MANQILAALSGLLQGAASGAIDRAEFDRKLREEAGRAKLMEAQMRGDRVSPEIGQAIGQSAFQAGVGSPRPVGTSGPTMPGGAFQPVIPETTKEAELVQRQAISNEGLSFKRDQEGGRQKREELRSQARKDLADAKTEIELQVKKDAEVNRRLDNARAEFENKQKALLAEGGGVLTERNRPRNQALVDEYEQQKQDIIQDVEEVYAAAWSGKRKPTGGSALKTAVDYLKLVNAATSLEELAKIPAAPPGSLSDKERDTVKQALRKKHQAFGGQ